MPDAFRDAAIESFQTESSKTKRDSLHPESRLTLDQLSPEVQPFAINVSKRILALCKKHGIEIDFDLSKDNTNLSQAVSDSVAMYIEKLQTDPSLMEDAKKLIQLQNRLTSIHETNTIPEEERMTINANPLENPFAYVHAAAELYTSLDLPEWAPPENTIELIEQMSPENRELVEKYQQEGWIAMYMPSRTVQMETLAKALKKLKPLWIRNGEVVKLGEPEVRPELDVLIAKKFPFLFKDIPDEPYIELTNPLPKVLVYTSSRTVDEQKELFETMSVLDPNIHVLGIPGYLAMQVWATYADAAAAKAIGDVLVNVKPMDERSESSTRFIDIPSSPGVQFDGCFYEGSNPPMLGFGSLVWNEQDPHIGFRVSVRVPIA